MIKWLVRHAPTVWLLVFSIVVFGSIAYISLPREASPDVKIPVVLVTTPYIGVSPADVESLVTIPIENELAGVKDVKKMSSTSAEGVSIISLEFEPDVVIEDALQRVRDRTNRARPKLPEDVEDPAIQEISFSDVPIMLVTMAGGDDQEQLKELAEALEEQVTRIPGVLDTRVSGGLTREVRVQLDPRRLSMYGLSFGDVSGAIGNENVNIPGGDVGAGNSTFLVRVPGEFTTARDLEDVAVKRVGDRPVFVRDLGRVVDGYKEADTYARMNGQPAVTLSVTKRAGASIIDIADEVKRLAGVHAETWPTHVTYEVMADQSKSIRDMVADLENNIITSLVLVVTVIIFFMGARNSFFVALAIPLSMLMSFVVIDMVGMTLNMIVLFSLILALGMLVDNAIVIIENIYRHMEEGKDIVQASIDGTSEVAVAVGASTATTVAAFFPLVFWTGIMGQFMGYLPKTVIIVLISSLVVAIVILPVVTSVALKRVPKTDGMKDSQADGAIMGAYKRLLETSIKHRYVSAAAGVLSLFLTFGIYGAFNHGTEFFPATEPNRATVALRGPDGTDLQATDRVVRRVEAALTQIENVEISVAESGVSGGGSPMGGTQANPSQAKLTLDFLPHKSDADDDDTPRVENTERTIETLRASLATIPGFEVEVNKEGMGPPVGDPISVEVSGGDFNDVGEFAAQVRRRIAGVPGVTDLKDDYRVGRPEMRLRIDRGAAKRVGASTAQVANTVRTAIAGTKASALRDGSDEYDIIVALDPRFAGSLQDVMSLRVPGRVDTSPETFQVPLSTVAHYELAGGSGAIRHVDQDLVVTISAKVIEGYNENAVRGEVIALMDEMRSGGEVPAGFDLRLGGANDEQQAASAFLGRAFLLAVALIAVVLVTQFNNFRLPAIVLFTVLLSLVGVLWGLLLTGTPFGVIMTGLGVISLAGVVVNNAIVLLDYVEQLRSRGMEMHEALVKAGMTRFRPVMLTAITTVLGLVPMALGVSIDFRNLKILIGGGTTQFWGPMAVAVIFGLAFATLLTLVMVPTLYGIFEDIDGLKKRMFPASPVGSKGAAAGAIGMLLLLVGGNAQAAPVSLDEAIAAAMGDSVDVALARERTREQETLKGQAWALLSPKLSAQGTYTINQYEIALDPSTFGDAQAQVDGQADLFEAIGASFGGLSDPAAPFLAQGWADGADEIRSIEVDTGDPIVIQQKAAWAGNLSLVQPLFTASALPTLRGAYKTIDVAQLQEQRTLQQLRAGVTRAYYGLATSRQAALLAEQGLVSAKNHLELATRQVNAGLQPPRARIQAQLAVARAERDQAAASERVTSAELAFLRLTGLPRDSELTMPPPVEVPTDLGEAVVRATTTRPDIQAADGRHRIADLTVTAKNLEWLPTLNGRFTYSYSENQGFQDEPTLWMVVLSADWTIWDGGLRIAQSKQYASQRRQAELAARQARDIAEEEVRVAWDGYQRATRALAATAGEVALAEENLRLAEEGLGAGSTTWLEVEDARLGLLQAQLSALNERVGRDLAAVDLQLATGRF
jgi:multidrug efflux pump subunit AcrB/outer membrane protein TolC